jgi:hypothetical protein
MAIAANSRTSSIGFMCVLGPRLVLQVAALSARLDEMPSLLLPAAQSKPTFWPGWPSW